MIVLYILAFISLVLFISYLAIKYRRWTDRVAKIEAQVEQEIRIVEQSTDVESISNIHRVLTIKEPESDASTLLHFFCSISEDVDAALNHGIVHNQRIALKAVVDTLDINARQLTSGSEKYAIRFRPITERWHHILTNFLNELGKVVDILQEIDNPYITGVPLNNQVEIFIGRTRIGYRIEELLLDRRRPPLLLYGQRRMGKTSLLNNLGSLLPNTVIPMFVDLQGAPSSSGDYAGFLYNIAKQMVKSAKAQSVSLPILKREDLDNDPFTCFDEWLDKVEQALEPNAALLALDEFEVLDNAIIKGRFDEQDVLGMLRHLIQHRPRFKLLLAGSHTLEEYQRWSSYLINVQVVHISYLQEAEARQLIMRPVKDFPLRYELDAIERVLQLTRCHPYLTQLLCSEIVALKNEQDPSVRRLATIGDVEAAVPEAFVSGSLFFADIQKNQVDPSGLAILRFIAAQGEGVIISYQSVAQKFPHLAKKFPQQFNQALDQLLQRELIEEAAFGYRFQVEMIRRWFAQKH